MAGPKGVNIPTSPATGRTATWSPTTANLLVLVALEIIGYCALRYLFRTAHGG